MSTASNMTLIETKTVGAGGAASIDFTSIPATYTDLKIVLSSIGTNTNVILRFNSSSTGYSFRNLLNEANSSVSYTQSAYSLNGIMAGYLGTSTAPCNTEIYIPNYAGSTNKSCSIEFAYEINSSVNYLGITAGLWSNTAAITSVNVTQILGGTPFAEGSTASLYGIKSVSKVVTPKATGGIISTSGNYVIHTFTASGTFTPSQDISNVEYLVIAGGGGGGQNTGGGGGAGGYRSSVTGESSGGGGSAESKLSLTSGTAYTVTVGAGGAGSLYNNQKGSSGSNSVFGSITSTGGGGGGSAYTTQGSSGGSGGGSGGNDIGGMTRTGGAGTSLQGYAGGNGTLNASNYGGGGGGGAGSVGGDGTSSVSGDGGAGLTSSITGTAVARAGGGGANGYTDAGTASAGGGAGGWISGQPSAGTAGTAFTGGGGGGGFASDGAAGGAAGGSGIVIVRYAA